MAELKNAPSSRDVSLVGSRRASSAIRGLPDVAPDFDGGLKQNTLHVAVPTTTAYLEESLSLLRKTLDSTGALAREGQLPDVELSSTGLKITLL